MPTIGILLPGSTLYPSIGMDFLQGIKSCFKFHEYDNVNYQVSMIGYGLKDDEIYTAAEKLVVADDCDVVVAFAGDYHAAKLAPLFAAAGKLLIITNAGANYPETFDYPLSHTLFHSLNDCLCCFLTGKYAARQEGGHGAAMIASFFDGGYRHTHAMNNAFQLSGGAIKHYYVNHFKKEEFNTDTLKAFINNNPDVKKILAVLSGDVARFIFKDLTAVQNELKLQWYASPMMFDCTPGDFEDAKPAVPDGMCGYTNWVPELDNEANRAFSGHYKNEHGKEANIFSLQGWENALLIMEYLQQRKAAANTEAAIDQLAGKQIAGPRGSIYLNEERHILAPAYLVSAKGNLQITVEDNINDTSEAWLEMKAQIPDETFSSWRNTYLCI
ncbi:MAG: ABC transporter substrate-binding protein [Ferruginibacter sp.]|nr:ABC transporter substrate-binding protein [Ferruginibacter sp.]